jgi:hypothetical protein
MGRMFQVAFVANVVLLAAYEVLYCNQLFNSTWERIRPDSMDFSWSPFVISMPYGDHEETILGTMYADGIVTVPNFIFFILVAMVCFNLIVIWKLEKTKPDTN